jgi:hypothetical protein
MTVTEESPTAFQKLTATMELRINDRDLALRLGCIPAETIKHHKELRDRGDMLVRDLRTPWMPMFWPWQLSPEAAREE